MRIELKLFSRREDKLAKRPTRSPPFIARIGINGSFGPLQQTETQEFPSVTRVSSLNKTRHLAKKFGSSHSPTVSHSNNPNSVITTKCRDYIKLASFLAKVINSYCDDKFEWRIKCLTSDPILKLTPYCMEEVRQKGRSNARALPSVVPVL